MPHFETLIGDVIETKGDESTDFQMDQSAKDILLIRTRLLNTLTIPEIDGEGEDLMNNEYLWDWSCMSKGAGLRIYCLLSVFYTFLITESSLLYNVLKTRS